MGKRALEGERTLSKDMPNYHGTYTSAAGWTFHNGWISKQSTAPGILMHETYFDLTGYQMEDLTLLPIAATLQDPGIYRTDDTTPLMVEMNIISQERISPQQFAEAVAFNQAMSFPVTDQDWNNITFGQWKLKLLTKEFDTTTLFNDMTIKDFGSGSACVVQKLYIYRIFSYRPADGKALEIPASRMVLTGMVTSEPELIYIQRLRRNYQTQGSVD